jgi:holo-[acyl-carrier protein] synthase
VNCEAGGLPDPFGREEAPVLAVGIDFVDVDEVQRAVTRFGDRYLRRVYTDHELDCSARGGVKRARHLALVFAAKEAAIKALAPSDRLPGWRSIEVRQAPDGRCSLQLGGHAAELATRARLSEFVLSLSHDGNLAAALVIASGRIALKPPECGGSESGRGDR